MASYSIMIRILRKLIKRKKNEKSSSKERKKRLTKKHSVEKQFYVFLKRINMEMYFESFKKYECSDMESISLFDEDTLRDDIKIKKAILRKKLLRHCKDMMRKMNEFKHEIVSQISPIMYEQLAQYGIVTKDILFNEVKHKLDSKKKFRIKNKNQINVIWNIIMKELNARPKSEGWKKCKPIDPAYINLLSTEQ